MWFDLSAFSAPRRALSSLFQLSLYPYVQCVMPMPARPHPDLIEGESLLHMGQGWSLGQIRDFFGVFSVALVFTSTPFYPPIGYKTRGKAVFGTCRACMEMNNQDVCGHTSDKDRAFKAVLTSGNSKSAIRLFNVEHFQWTWSWPFPTVLVCSASTPF